MKNFIKKTLKKIIRPFVKISYINNYIYKDTLLIGRTAIITGGSSGIGFAIAKSFVINGANVIIIGRNEKKLNEAEKELKNYINKDNGNIVTCYSLDLENVSKIQECFNQITKEFNSIDILVNNAGVILGENIGKTSIEDYERCLSINLESIYFLSQYFCEYLCSKNIKGNVLNVLSSSAMRPAVKPYTISKWGLKGLTLGLAKKYIEKGIVVNGIAPGQTYTPMLVGNSKEINLSLESNPSKRYATPEEIANGALFLVSDMGKMVVGDILYMTGGAGIITVDDIFY